MKLLLDGMLWPAAAVQLRQRGHDVRSIADDPVLRTAPDAIILEAARAEERALVTEDVGDFRRIASWTADDGDAHWGLIFLTDRRFPRSDPRTLGRLVTALDNLLKSDIDLRGREHWLS